MNTQFSLQDFQQYLIEKQIPDTCPCCQKSDVSYSAFGMVKRANVEDEHTGNIIRSSDVDDNVGLGIVETVVNQAGTVTDIRFGAYPTFFIRCNHCGFMRTFDAKFVQEEYQKLVHKKQSSSEEIG